MRFNSKIAILYYGNESESFSNEMMNCCIEKGTSYHLTVPNTLQLYDILESMVRAITEKARAMLDGVDLYKVFRRDVAFTATYLIIITPSNALKQLRTPHKMWQKKTANRMFQGV